MRVANHKAYRRSTAQLILLHVSKRSMAPRHGSTNFRTVNKAPRRSWRGFPVAKPASRQCQALGSHLSVLYQMQSIV